MRIVVVEDEKKTRQGLKMILEKYTEHEVCGVANDGQEGFEMVCSLKPDIVFTDIRMPAMNGLEMLEKLREMGMQTRAVLLTGYSDFEYARRSIQLTVDDYLLKPLNVEEILEVLDKVEQTKSEMVSEEQLLFSVLTDQEKDGEVFAEQLEKRLHIHSGEPVSLFLLKNSSMLAETTNEMTAMLEEVLPAVCLTNYHIFRLPESHYILVLILDGQSVHYMKELFLMHISPAAVEIGECMVAYREMNGLRELKKVLRQMQENFKYGFGLEKLRILDEEFIESCRFEEMPYPDILEQTIRLEIRSGNNGRIQEMVEKFRKMVIDSNMEPEYIKEYTVRFLLAYIQGVRSIKENDMLEFLSHSLISRIMNCESRKTLQYEYQKITDLLMREEREEDYAENGMIMNVIEFIRLNYEKDITLTDAADVAGITPEYLSKLFTKEIGVNFSTFLRNFRIRTAKSMLMEEKYKIYEVAEAVGYRDTKYFNKVFKSVAGLSPTDFRKAAR